MPGPSNPIDLDAGAVRQVDVLRDGRATPEIDHVAVERPLEVRLNGEPFAVIMRTPGADRPLVLGFLLTEGVLQRRSQVTRVDLDDDAGIANVVFSRESADAVAEALAGPPAGVAQLVVRPLRPPQPRVADVRRAALPDRVDNRRGARRAIPRDAAGRRSPPSREPAGCTRPACSISTGGWTPAPRMSGVTTPSTSCSAACSTRAGCR